MIKQHIEAIQQEIKEKYGLSARVDIIVHRDMQNTSPCQSKANDFICGIQPAIGEGIKIDQGKSSKWMECESWEGQKRAVIFYE